MGKLIGLPQLLVLTILEEFLSLFELSNLDCAFTEWMDRSTFLTILTLYRISNITKKFCKHKDDHRKFTVNNTADLNLFTFSGIGLFYKARHASVSGCRLFGLWLILRQFTFHQMCICLRDSLTLKDDLELVFTEDRMFDVIDLQLDECHYSVIADKLGKRDGYIHFILTMLHRCVRLRTLRLYDMAHFFLDLNLVHKQLLRDLQSLHIINSWRLNSRVFDILSTKCTNLITFECNKCLIRENDRHIVYELSLVQFLEKNHIIREIFLYNLHFSENILTVLNSKLSTLVDVIIDQYHSENDRFIFHLTTLLDTIKNSTCLEHLYVCVVRCTLHDYFESEVIYHFEPLVKFESRRKEITGKIRREHLEDCSVRPFYPELFINRKWKDGLCPKLIQITGFGENSAKTICNWFIDTKINFDYICFNNVEVTDANIKAVEYYCTNLSQLQLVRCYNNYTWSAIHHLAENIDGRLYVYICDVDVPFRNTLIECQQQKREEVACDVTRVGCDVYCQIRTQYSYNFDWPVYCSDGPVADDAHEYYSDVTLTDDEF